MINKHPKVVSLLGKSLHDKNVDVRIYTVEALGKAVLKYRYVVLSDSEEIIRFIAAKIIRSVQGF